ncbi:MAG TPA: ABC transporter ATP-binding protein [Aestuariivirgaceae bacterium]|nr:ABC transporter ATP-binding protein [Aestuariivirgaceae bacterium]
MDRSSEQAGQRSASSSRVPVQRPTAVEARDVGKAFGAGEAAVRALDGVSLAIRENEFFTLLGPSGCGKTTLLRLVAGFEHPSHGHILLYGTDISALPPFRRPVNTVFQNYALFPHLTVAQNVAFGLEMLGRARADVEATVAGMLKLVRLQDLKDRRISQISGGQQQRVALARALAPQPKVLLLDEPLSALDLKLRKEMQIELKRLQHETGITFIFVTHDQEEALTMSDRIAVMDRGRVLQVGTPREIYDHPRNRFVANFIGDTNFLSGRIVKAEGGRATVKLTSGATISAHLGDRAAGSGEATIVVRPEHARLVTPGNGSVLTGRIANVVYFGTDTHYHLALDDGSPFTIRHQNAGGAAGAWAAGSAAGVTFDGEAAQVLSD